ncbi:MAG: carboxypeptidase regulatory-like domain-containing protein, partial [Candidatus Heimdallarchaeota archaeon]|nr:carboxypeptidase regulatory-like domain-containing protein [Candidatus Heimdallarchaeota archaeon]
MPNETLQISGTIRDAYSSAAVANMNISAQWEGSGLVYETFTSPTGAFSISLLTPSTINPTLRNGTVNLFSTSTQFYTPSNYSFLVDVFTEAQFTITLNSTIVIDDSNVTRIGGEPIYINSNLTFNGFVMDQFGRPIKSRTITISISGLGSIGETLNDSGYFSIAVNNSLGYTVNISYTITITFDADTSYDFNFDISFRSLPVETPTNGGSTTPTEPGGFDMAVIGVLIAMVSLIIIVSVVYAFGRFRKSKKGMLPGPDAELMDLSSIMKQIAEADKAKDYRRGIVLSFRAFELICMQSLRILSARDQSPRELARLVASTNRIPVRDVTMLVMRYEEARFSDHRITKNQFNHAMQALENVQLALKQDPNVT